jgi:D-3-phosphoglycerate dehydrogenase
MNVLFLDTVHPVLQDRLQQAGHHCIERFSEKAEALHSEFSQADGIVLRSRFRIDAHILDLCPNLKFIARSGSGLENIDLDAAKIRGIEIFNSPEGNSEAVGEHALGMLLMLFNNLCRSDRQVRNGKWVREGNRGIELGNKTVGIIGYGHTGQSLARKLSGFDCKILAFDKYKSGFGTDRIIECGLEDIFSNCDIISFHVPLTPETNYMADLEFFNSFSKSICIINTSRGPVLNTGDLVKAMQSEKIWGACLDVLEYEENSFEYLSDSKMPEPLKWLTSSDKVVLTPHVAGWTKESYYKLSSFLADKILARFP